MFLAVFLHWDDQNGNIHFLFLLVELCLIEMLSSILKYVTEKVNLSVALYHI